MLSLIPDEMLMMTPPHAPRRPPQNPSTLRTFLTAHVKNYIIENTAYHGLGRFWTFLVFGTSSAASPSIMGGHGCGLGRREKRRGGEMSEGQEKEREGRKGKEI